MKKRISALLLALALCMGLAALPVNAQSVPHGQAPAVAQAGAPGTSAALDGTNLKVYNWLKGEFTKVADGTLGSSTFKLNTSGMGISYTGGKLQGIDVSTVVYALLVDCPYELYWFDKIKGYTTSYSYSGFSGTVSSMTFQFSVSQDYAVANGASSYQLYRPDTEKTAAAAAAAQNAQAVVERSSGLSDYDKLAAYRDYICGQVSYNQAAVNSSSYPYGDPWQLIYVFDGDPDTNVVCEGYAKAFKYLCDLTDFSSQVECYLVSGRTQENHMWNLVRINGQSYLADVTNCDTGSAGQFGGLFLAGVSNATGNGCTISLPKHSLGNGHYIPAQSISYTYDSDTKALYDEGVLTLAASDYTAAAQAQASTPTPSFTDVPTWCAPAVNWAARENVTTGATPTTFAPGRDCTHEQILTFLYRAADEPTASATAPVTVDAAYVDAVNWAYGEGMIDASFDPKALCTRANAVTYIWLALGSLEAGGGGFTDVPAGADYAAAVAWAVEAGVAEGYPGNVFRPDTVCSRGVIVTLLHRAYVPEARLTANP